KQVVHRAAVDVEVVTQRRGAHCRALDVPTRPTRGPRRLSRRPGRLPWAAGLPQGEIRRVPFALKGFGEAAASPGLPALQSVARQLPVTGEALDVVQYLTIDHVSVALVEQPSDQLDLRVDEIGGSGVQRVVLDAEQPAIPPKRGDHLLGNVEPATLRIGL